MENEPFQSPARVIHPSMSVTIYEQPLNERIRTLLRLDFLFRQVDHNLNDSSHWGSRAAVATLIDIINVFARSDLRTDLIKELERLATCLSPLTQSPGDDQEALANLLPDLDRLIDRLHAMPPQVGSNLREHEFLNAIRQRASIPGGACDFDLPAYHHWLNQGMEERHNDIRRWRQSLDALRETAALVIRLVRESGQTAVERAEQGFFQQSLDTSVPYQLVRVILPKDSPYFAEISGGKHRFTIRFMEQSLHERPQQTGETVEFRLVRCAI